MKSIKDAINLYRTMAAEALADFSFNERGEWFGKRLDDRAYALSVQIRPRDAGQPLGEGRQNIGWLDETAGPRAIFDEVQEWQADAARSYLDGMRARMIVGPTSAAVYTGLFKPQVDRAEQMREAMQPMLEKLGEVLGDPDKVEWREPEIRTAEAVAKATEAMKRYALPEFDVPSFADFDVRSMQDGINDMARRLAEAQDYVMRGAVRHRFIAGVDPEQEWIDIPKYRIEEHLVGKDPDGLHPVPGEGRIFGIPLYQHPDDKDTLRVRTADVQGDPHGWRMVKSLSDPTDTVDTDAHHHHEKDAPHDDQH